MSKKVWRPMGVAVLVLATLFTAGVASGQEGDSPKPVAKAAKKAGARLPPYFGEVVSQEQRDKIYDLQTKFLDQIQKLRDEITALEAKQKEEVAAVLTADQRAQVEKMAAEAKEKRSKKNAKDKPAPTEESAPAASTTAAN